MKPTIIYHDNDIIIVNKPSGMLSIPDRFEHNAPNVKRFLQNQFEEVFTLHRLDKDTSGILVFAKNADAHRHISMQFEQHTIEKIYYAIVRGIFEKESLEIDIPLAPDTVKKGLMKPSARGKESFTKVFLKERFRVASLMECRPRTGRQHQIRVHLAAIGHPMLVDKDYGSIGEFFLSTIKRKFKLAKNTEEKPIMSRVPLHAFALELIHPGTNLPIRFEADMPKDMTALLNILRKYAPYQDFSAISSFDEWI